MQGMQRQSNEARNTPYCKAAIFGEKRRKVVEQKTAPSGWNPRTEKKPGQVTPFFGGTCTCFFGQGSFFKGFRSGTM